MIGECLLCSPPPRLSLVLTFIAAAIILAAAVTLTNFAQAEVTGKAVPPTGGACPDIVGQHGTVQNSGQSDWNSTPPLAQVVICESTVEEYNRTSNIGPGQSTTLTTSTHRYVIEGRLNGGNFRTGVSRIIDDRPPPTPAPDPAPDPNPTNPPDNNNGNMPGNTPDNTPSQAATVQAKSSNDAKRLAQYGAAGFAAFVLIHNYWLGAPLGVLPLNMAYNDKGAIFSGTSFRISPQETIHLSALESVDDKRGEYKFGVQWHYQFAPPRGLTETPAAALPAIYTMPNVTPKDWLSDDDGIRRGNDR